MTQSRRGHNQCAYRSNTYSGISKSITVKHNANEFGQSQIRFINQWKGLYNLFTSIKVALLDDFVY